MVQLYTSTQFEVDKGFNVFKTRPEIIDITDQLTNGNRFIDPTEEIILMMESDTLTAAFYKSGIFLNAKILPATLKDKYINFQILVPQSFRERTRGFFGNFDDDDSNDLRKRGNTTSLPCCDEKVVLMALRTCKYTNY